MSQDILITPKSGEPQILFRGSGVNDTAVELNVLSSYQSATGSGSALLFEGEQGQLFAITDNLSSGIIFSVADITGLPAIEYNASGELSLGEFASNITIYSNNGLVLNSGTPSSTTDSLYNNSQVLYFDGSPVGIKSVLNTESDGATITFDMNEANLHTVTLGGNRTLAVSNVDAGQKFIIRLTQDGTGSRTVTWFSTIKWPGNLAPTLTTTGGKTDVFGFICTSAGNYDGYVIGYNL